MGGEMGREGRRMLKIGTKMREGSISSVAHIPYAPKNPPVAV